LADVLAGEPGSDAIHPSKLFRADSAHVLKVACLGKSVTKHSPVEGVNFDGPGGLPPGPLKSEVEASNACEEASNSFLFVLMHLCQSVKSVVENPRPVNPENRVNPV
jgi:hypothetical protein